MSPSAFLDKPVFKLEIVLCLLWARLLISCLPFRWWRSRLGPIVEDSGASTAPALTKPQLKKASDTGRIIARVARHMPFRADCLPQAMTGRWMLARRGIATRIAIGSRKDASAESLLFHAWLRAGERIVTGGEESANFCAFGAQSD